MYQRPSREEDIKAQVLSKFLRMQEEAEKLFDNGQNWNALLKYQTFISSLILTDDEYKNVDKIFELIDKIRTEALDPKNANGSTSMYLRYNRDKYRNRRAFEEFHNIVRTTNRVLRDSGYYNFLLKGGRPPTKKDETLERLLEG